jgi:hypothetical protein
MKSFLSQSIQPLLKIWRRFTSDDHIYRLARRHSRASGWTLRTFRMEFHRNDYATILKASRISKQSDLTFLQQAALERARFILQVENSGRRQ